MYNLKQETNHWKHVVKVNLLADEVEEKETRERKHEALKVCEGALDLACVHKIWKTLKTFNLKFDVLEVFLLVNRMHILVCDMYNN